MLDFFRNHTRLFQGLLVLLVFPSFVFFGVQGYSGFNSERESQVAVVDGHGIPRAEWDAAVQSQVDRMRQQLPGVDVKLIDTPQLRREVLDRLVRERVLAAAAAQQHLGVSDAQLHRLFTTDPQFEPLRNPDGTVNRELLAAQGMSSDVFAERLRQELAMRQVLQGIAGSVVAPVAVVDPAIDAVFQRRQVQLQRFDPKDYRSKLNPTEAEIEAYYKAHEPQYRAPEQATIEYVVLDAQALKAGISVPEEELRRYYDENIAHYTTAEERRASHILIAADKGLAADERAKAKAKAEALLEQLRRNPGEFAELARKSSNDPGSAAEGGDLGFFGRGAMVKPFEDAVFAMKPGEISNVVDTDFGYHVIRLDAVRGGDKKPFDAVRAQIEDEVKKQLAQKRYAEAAEQFSNTVYEQSDSLQPVIDKLKLSPHRATVQRTPAPGATGPLASAKLLEAVFSDDSVRNKRNTDAVEVGPNQLAAARIVDYRPAHTLPLAEVKERVREAVIAQQAAALARKDGEKLYAELQGGAATALPESLVVGRAAPQGLPRAAIEAILGADPAKLPQPVGVDLGDQGYLVARVQQVLPRDPGLGAPQALQAQYAQAIGNAEAQAYYEALKSRYKVEIKPAAQASAPER